MDELMTRSAASSSNVETLLVRLNDLSRERQDLHTRHVDRATLERNRLEIVDAQWALSHALIARYLPHQLAA